MAAFQTGLVASTLVAMMTLAACSSTGPAAGMSPGARHSLAEAMEDDSSPGTLDPLREAALKAPADAAAQERYGLAAEQARRYPEALAALGRAIAAGGPNPARLVEQGRIATKMGDVPAAAAAFGKAVELDPRNVDALSGLGVTEDLDNRHADAQRHYRQALGLSPSDWGVRSNLAVSLLMSNRPAEAADALAGAADDPAAPRRARQDLAMALVASGDRSRAIKVLQQDVPAAEAPGLADEFASFAKWLTTSRTGQ